MKHVRLAGADSQQKDLRTTVLVTAGFAFAIIAGTIYVMGKQFAR